MEKEKQLNNGNNSMTKEDATQSFECKFTEEPQNNLNSSESGQQYEIIEGTPFAIVKRGEVWKIAIGDMFATPYEFVTKEAAKDYIEEKPWVLIWTAAIWLINNQQDFMIKKQD